MACFVREASGKIQRASQHRLRLPRSKRPGLLDFRYTAHNAIDIILASDEDDQYQRVENYVSDILLFPDDLVVADQAGLTAFHRATLKHDVETAENIFKNTGAGPDFREASFGLMPVHLAAFSDDPFNMLDLLAKSDGNLQMPDLIEAWTPMNFIALSRVKMTICDQEVALSLQKEFPVQYLKAFYSSCKSHDVNNLTTSEIQYLFEF